MHLLTGYLRETNQSMDLALNIALIVAGVTCLIALIVHKNTDSSHSRRVAFLAALVILAVLGTDSIRNVASGWNPLSTDNRRHAREYMRMGGFYLGQYLQYADSTDERGKILVLGYPDDFPLVGAEYSNDIIAGLRDGLASHGLLSLEAVEYAQPANRSRTWLTAAEFDRMIKAHPEVGMVVSLVGLPADPENVTFWNEPNPPRFVLFGGNLEHLQEALRRKFILAVVTFVPGVPVGGDRPPDPKQIETEFFDRFLLITPQNMEMTKEIFPVLFK
jgi:hypothetical protein